MLYDTRMTIIILVRTFDTVDTATTATATATATAIDIAAAAAAAAAALIMLLLLLSKGISECKTRVNGISK